jgi:DNA-directed RNA polymerase specialized sigma24 family protein
MRGKNQKGECMLRMGEETTRDEGNRTLYDRFTLTILTYICQQVSNTQDVEDLLVEVFLAAFNYEAFLAFLLSAN